MRSRSHEAARRSAACMCAGLPLPFWCFFLCSLPPFVCRPRRLSEPATGRRPRSSCGATPVRRGGRGVRARARGRSRVAFWASHRVGSGQRCRHTGAAGGPGLRRASAPFSAQGGPRGARGFPAAARAVWSRRGLRRCAPLPPCLCRAPPWWRRRVALLELALRRTTDAAIRASVARGGREGRGGASGWWGCRLLSRGRASR